MAVTAGIMCVVLLVPTLWGSLFTAAIMPAVLPAVAGLAIMVAALLPAAAIFLYKRRRLQMRLLAVEFVLILAAAGLVGWYIWTAREDAGATPMGKDFWFSFYPAYIALAAILTNWFALRGVKKDEKLVRSVDRIR